MTLAAHSQFYPSVATKGLRAAVPENQAWVEYGVTQLLQTSRPGCLGGPQPSCHHQQPFPTPNSAVIMACSDPGSALDSTYLPELCPVPQFASGTVPAQ